MSSLGTRQGQQYCESFSTTNASDQCKHHANYKPSKIVGA